MKTPASVWTRSERKYDPQLPAWEYPVGAWTLKIDCQGKVEIKGRSWKIGRALTGERVRIEAVEDRFLVYYCSTLVREIDPVIQRSTMVERWITDPQKPPLV